MATVNRIDFRYLNGEVGYDAFRLQFATTGLAAAETQLIERIENAGLADERITGTITIRDDGMPPQVRIDDRRVESFQAQV